MNKKLQKELDRCIILLEENNNYGLCSSSPITFVVFSDYNKIVEYSGYEILNNPQKENLFGRNVFAVIIDCRGKYTTDIKFIDIIVRLSSRFLDKGKIIFINNYE
jgi:hypothetical protein